MTDRTVEAYLLKAEESLGGAEGEFAAARYNNCANRAYYACFQAAIAAILREKIPPAGRDGRWGRVFVESQFVGQLVNRRHRFPSDRRTVLADTRDLRQKGDYLPGDVTRGEANPSHRHCRGVVAVFGGGRGCKE